MVDKLQTFASQIRTRGISLFLIAKMDELADKWTIILSTPWVVDDRTRQEAFKLIWDYLNQNLDTTERATIARIGVFGSQEPLIGKFHNYLMLDNSRTQLPFRVTNFKINGNFVYDAIIIDWNRDNSANFL